MSFLIHVMKFGMLTAPLAHRSCLVLGLALLLAACGTTKGPNSSSQSASGPAVGSYKLGKPYRIKGRWYRPEYDPSYTKVGTASWYGADFHGLATANGEVFDKEQITAAHPTLPLPSLVRVTNLDNGQTIDVRVNDRGPFIDDRLIDLSQAAARRLGYEQRGLARVRVEFLGLADARGTPPQPTVVRYAAPAPKPQPPIQLAAATVAAAAPNPLPARAPLRTVAPAPVPARTQLVACTAEDQFVQVGAYAETDQVLAAMASLEGLGQVRVEPAFAGNRAVARVRLGPVAGSDASRMLARVAALGYTDAFLIPAPHKGDVTLVSC
ncbi:MAG: septal ring lytic transglycosylase RlpA family protein [Geminicoccaceae bacterium]